MASISSNAIALSPDMQTLHLIDKGRNISFNLKSNEGVLVGTLKNQITAISSPFEPNAILKRSDETYRKLPTKGNKWQIIYDEDNTSFFVIGAIDIEGFTPKSCQTYGYDLSGHLLHLRNNGGSLELFYLKG